MNPTAPTAWLAQQFELSRAGDANNLRPMEGLRGLAVLLVFCVHFATASEPWTTPSGWTRAALETAYTVGHCGVDLFFVLSGFLIYGNLIGSGTPFLKFMARRVRRLYPTFLVVLAIYLMLSLALPAESKLPAGPLGATMYIGLNLLMLPGILDIEPIIRVAWSLSYEMFFYLVAPLVIAVFALRRRAPAWRLRFVAALTIISVAAAALLGGHMRLLLFLAGLLLCETLRLRPTTRLPAFAPWLALAAVAAAMLTPMPGPMLQTLRMVVLGVSFYVLCYAAFTDPDRGAGFVFAWTPVRWLGNMSYSYYLLHGLVIKSCFVVLDRLLPVGGADAAALALLPAVLAVTLVASALLFLGVERPLSLARNKAARLPFGASPPSGAAR